MAEPQAPSGSAAAPVPGPNNEIPDIAAAPPPLPTAGTGNRREQQPPGPHGNQLMDVRDRLFHALFIKAALLYAIMVPKPMRRIIELVLFMKALVAFFSLVYIHYTFSMSPATCLKHIEDYWPRHGVLHIEINRNFESHQKFVAGWPAPNGDSLEFLLPQNPMKFDLLSEKAPIHEILDETNYKNFRMYSVWHNLMALFKSSIVQYEPPEETKAHAIPEDESPSDEPVSPTTEEPVPKEESVSKVEPVPKEDPPSYSIWDEDEQYIVEYSLEYGFLRISNTTRERMNIPVLYVYLNPDTDKCFGDNLSRLILTNFLGYDDLLMASVKVLAEKEDNKGYLRNLVTGEHFRFISSWWVPRGSFVAAFFVMLLFTVSISMLLRYSHHQIFIFIVDLLQMLEFNVSARFPAAPLLTVILALVGMEAIMSEFFNDTTTAFYVILIVWVADQFDAICCHTSISKRHWLRFFYLYQYSFYAYHFRFNGQYSGLALLTAWLFMQHSMIYFFHHYELPVIIRQAQLQQIFIRNRNVGGGGVGGNQDANQQNQPPAAEPRPGPPVNVHNIRYNGLLGVFRSEPRPGNVVVGGLASFRMRPYSPNNNNLNTHNNNNTVNGPNGPTIAGGVGASDGNNGQTNAAAESGGRRPILGATVWQPLQLGNRTAAIIGGIRYILGGGRIVAPLNVNNNNAGNNDTANNSAGQTGAAGSAPDQGATTVTSSSLSVDPSSTPAEPGGDTESPTIGGDRQQHHHHHPHLHRRLPGIVNLAHLQRISLGRITISPDSARTAETPVNRAHSTGATTVSPNNRCNESEAQIGDGNGNGGSGDGRTPEMESNVRQESDSHRSASMNRNTADLIIEAGDKLPDAIDNIDQVGGGAGAVFNTVTGQVCAGGSSSTSSGDEQKNKHEESARGSMCSGSPGGESGPITSMDKLNSDGVSSKVRVPEGREATAELVAVDQKAKTTMKLPLTFAGCELTGDSNLSPVRSADSGDALVGQPAGEGGDAKLANINVNCNQHIINTTLNNLLEIDGGPSRGPAGVEESNSLHQLSVSPEMGPH